MKRTVIVIDGESFILLSLQVTGRLVVSMAYAADDPFLSLPEEKQKRKIIADAQRILAVEADKRSHDQITIRG